MTIIEQQLSTLQQQLQLLREQQQLMANQIKIQLDMSASLIASQAPRITTAEMMDRYNIASKDTLRAWEESGRIPRRVARNAWARDEVLKHELKMKG